MNKIISGMLSIVAAFALVAGTAFATFTSQVTVTGVTLAAGTSGLEVFDASNSQQLIGNNQSESVTTLGLPDPVTLVPGEPQEVQFTLRNTGNVNLNLAGRAEFASGTNADLAGLMKVTFNFDGDTSNPTWSVSQFESANRVLDYVLNAGQEVQVTLVVALDNNVPNTLQGEKVNLNFTLTGTETD